MLLLGHHNRKKSETICFWLISLLILLFFHLLLFTTLYFVPNSRYKPKWMRAIKQSQSAPTTTIEFCEPTPATPLDQLQKPIDIPDPALIKSMPMPKPDIPAALKPGATAFDPSFDPTAEDDLLVAIDSPEVETHAPDQTEEKPADKIDTHVEEVLPEKFPEPPVLNTSIAEKEVGSETIIEKPFTEIVREKQAITPPSVHTRALTEAELKQYALRNLLKDPNMLPLARLKQPEVEKKEMVENKTDPSTKNTPQNKASDTLKPFSCTRGFIDNIDKGGCGMLEREGDESKTPSFKEIPFISYLNKMIWSIQKGMRMYRQPSPDALIQIYENQVALSFNIMLDGNIKDLVAYSATHHGQSERIAKEIIRLSAPFSPIPRHLGRDHLEINMEYSLHGNIGRTNLCILNQ